MIHFKNISQSDIELYNRSKNDIICFASREIAIFLCSIPIIFHIQTILLWVSIAIGGLLALFSIIWDVLITLGKVKSVRGKFLWIIIAIQGISITLFLFLKSNASLIMAIVLIFQVVVLGAALIIGQRRGNKVQDDYR